MTLEFANRLASMRKEKGYSQEELAEKLGVSRQAVSKWERGEASPDTDNLIALAALYEVTLDALVQGKLCAGAKKKESVHIGFDGIHVENEKESVHISLQNGIHVCDADGQDVFGKNGHWIGHVPDRRKSIADAVCALGVTLIYLLLGFLRNAWHPGWLVFLAIPLLSSLWDAVCKKDAACFAWPVLTVIVYLCGGFFYALWHPLWVVFLTIPLYYMVVKLIQKKSVQE